jgi:hypothetical protein
LISFAESSDIAFLISPIRFSWSSISLARLSAACFAVFDSSLLIFVFIAVLFLLDSIRSFCSFASDSFCAFSFSFEIAFIRSYSFLATSDTDVSKFNDVTF